MFKKNLYLKICKPHLAASRIAPAWFYGLCFLQSAALISSSANASVDPNETIFTDDTATLSASTINRRKFSAPVVADLDQDGRSDILTIEHGGEVNILWNESGTFSRSPVITTGDLHGVAVADHDRDGLMEVLITQGGAGGNEPRVPRMFEIGRDRQVTQQTRPVAGFEPSRGRSAVFIDSGNNGVLDIVAPSGRPSQTNGRERFNFIYQQNQPNDFSLSGTLDEVSGSARSLSVTDFDSDGTLDLFVFGKRRFGAFRGTGRVSYEDVTDSVLPIPMRDITGMVPFDFDNDGDEDLFVTRDERPGDAFIRFNENSSTVGFAGRPGPNSEFVINVSSNSLKLANYIAVGKEKVIFLGSNATRAALTNPRSSGQQLTIRRDQAQGFPTATDQAGLYIGYIGNNRWRVRITSFRNSSAVIRNVIALEESTLSELTPREGNSSVLYENRGGRYIDVTNRSRISQRGATGATAGDFDNNGYQDLFVSLYGSLTNRVRHMVFLNNGDGSFTRRKVRSAASFRNGIVGLTGETIDYNEDGHLDMVYVDEYGVFRLLQNTLASNNNRNHLTVRVGNSNSGASPLGAILRVNGCGSNWHRRVGYAGEPRNQGSNTTVHVGLGDCANINSVGVTYTTGETLNLRNNSAPAVNSRIDMGQL